MVGLVRMSELFATSTTGTVIEVILYDYTCENVMHASMKQKCNNLFLDYFLLGGCSAIAAMSTKGVEVVSVHEDIIDGDMYLKVLEEKVLPLMNPYPGEKSVLFNDNAPVHNKASIMTLCQEYGVIAVFFEPYSYDYNPIELVFHSAKDFCRRKWPSDDPRCPVAKNFEDALYNCVTGDIACNYFAHCHINVTREERYRASGR